LLGSLNEGASGGILALAACAPQACQEIYLSWKDHDFKLAEDKQKLIAPVNKRIVGDLGISGVKYACDFNGYYGGRARSPLLGLTAQEKTDVEKLLAEMRN
jgi:dihydrodipicolinate synthase/N-acetylneuraminate lyase